MIRLNLYGQFLRNLEKTTTKKIIFWKKPYFLKKTKYFWDYWWRKYRSNFFWVFNLRNVRRCSRLSTKSAIFVEKSSKIFRNHPKTSVSGKNIANWKDELHEVTKKNNNKQHSATKLTLIEAYSAKNEDYVYTKLFDKRKKIKPKYEQEI